VPFFRYRALDKHKEVIKGTFFADDRSSLEKFLINNDLLLISAWKSIPLLNLIRDSDVLDFFIHLKTASENNLDAIASLKLCGCGVRNKFFAAVVRDMETNVSRGLYLSKCMKKYESIFGLLSIKMIEVAERSSTMVKSLDSIIRYLSTKIEMKSSARSLLIYPSILLSTIFTVILFWCFFIVPEFVECFSDMSIPQNLVTEKIMSFRAFVLGNYIVLSILSVILLLFLLFRKQIPMIAKYKLNLVSKIPILRNLKRDLQMMDFFSGMDILLQGEVHVVDALDVNSSIVRDLEFQEKIGRMLREIKTGMSLSIAAKESGLFTDHEYSLVIVAGETGTVKTLFSGLLKITKSRIDKKLKNLISMLQPFSIILTGIILMVVLYSVMSPIYYSLNTNF
jgi:type II secretory pathway component PulF